eukprot:sb/3462468/
MRGLFTRRNISGVPGLFECPFAPNNITTCDSKKTMCLNETWSCILEERYRCDGTSQCLKDECGCPDTPVVYCPNGAGCVPFDQLCDGLPDCPNGEDERACRGLQTTQCKVPRITVHARSRHLCTGPIHYAVECDDSCIKFQDKAISDCMGDLAMMVAYRYVYSTDRLVERCKTKCNISTNICDMVVGRDRIWIDPMLAYAGECENGTNQISITELCDEKVDCEDKSDERYCPGRFYCSTERDKLEWIGEEKVCDNYKDCSNGMDECAGCSRGPFSSDNKIIQSYLLLALSLVTMLVIVSANLYNGVTIDYRPTDLDHIKIDRYLNVCLIAHDVTMGVYLACLVAANFRYYGNYCQYDTQWRTGTYCQLLGIMFSVSSHGSLFIVILMAVTRATKCVNPLSQGISPAKVYAVSWILMSLNLIHALVPLIKHGALQEVFRSEIQIPNSNPFVVEYTDMSSITEIHKVFFSEKRSSDFYQKIHDLKSVTNRPEIFEVQDYSLYSWSPVCLPNMFTVRPGPMVVYKLVYIAVICLILLTIGVSYGCILWQLVKPVPGRHDSSFVEICQKVAVIVGVKLITWMFVAGIMVYTMLTDQLVTSTWYELTAIVILPLNSCINPVCHSDLYNKGRGGVIKLFAPLSALFSLTSLFAPLDVGLHGTWKRRDQDQGPTNSFGNKVIHPLPACEAHQTKVSSIPTNSLEMEPITPPLSDVKKESECCEAQHTANKQQETRP